YFVQSKDDAIWVYKSDELTQPTKHGVQVWAAPHNGWNRSNVWAPELHYLDGQWYIYYAAGKSGPPFLYQRSGVLQSAGDDPQGRYIDKGMLYTGNDVRSGAENIWAIDLTVTRLGSQLYAVWSGWEANAATDRTPQHLYIARMSDPWTISSNRVRISSPTESWERGTELDLNEGPEFLQHGEIRLASGWLSRLRHPRSDGVAHSGAVGSVQMTAFRKTPTSALIAVVVAALVPPLPLWSSPPVPLSVPERGDVMSSPSPEG